ncbi:Tyrosine-protein kinase [Parasponia andersonii]|uniref:Tyrosine-protein kinase n=1 Tax=Parasponia andersonii TaxID=3476 RepID=A0A2P5B3Y4_PARAD|nr:Tyrosine-protein kinase [Parasponia andersonii]
MGCGCFGALNWCKGKNNSDEAETPGISTNNVRLFSYNSLRSATRDFHPSNRIGGGGYGVVHRGVLRDDNVTHVSTRVAGTVGYLAPEYALLGQLTKKADVYSFGVLLLEVISGRSSSKAAFGEELLVLVEWTWKLREEGRLLDVVDPELTTYPEDEVTRFVKVAMFCTQAVAHQRPSMRQVVEMLSKQVHLNEKALTEPGVYRAHTSRRSAGVSSEETSSSQADKGKQLVNPPTTQTQSHDSDSITQMFPR